MNVTCIVRMWLDDVFICRILFKQIETSGSGPAKKDKVNKIDVRVHFLYALSAVVHVCVTLSLQTALCF